MFHKKSLAKLGLANLLLVFSGVPMFAQQDFAHWSLQTPGGHTIMDMDPWSEAHGICLKDLEGDQVHVSHIEWWQYYEGIVVGESRSGYFFFREDKPEVTFFNKEASVIRALGKTAQPLSAVMEPKHGWAFVWQYTMARDRLERKNVAPELRKVLQRILKPYRGRVYDNGAVIYLLEK